MTWILKLKDMILGPKREEKSLSEQRRSPRVNCFIEAQFASEDKSVFDGNICILETSGMRIVTPAKMEKGRKVIVTVENFSGVLMSRPFTVDRLNAEVVWCRKKHGFSQFMAGIKFTDSPEVIQKSWVRFVLDSFGVRDVSGFQRRKEIRVETSLPAKCQYGKKKATEGKAFDLSIDGAKLSLKSDVGEGTEVIVEIGPYKRLQTIYCRGKVKRSNYNTGTDSFMVGVEFLGLDDNQIKLIGSYVRTLLKELSL